MLNTTVQSATVALDKNGHEYVRLIINEERNMNGISYEKGVPVMAFGDLVEPAKSYNAGDQLKAIANYRQLPDGRESYSVIQFVK